MCTLHTSNIKLSCVGHVHHSIICCIHGSHYICCAHYHVFCMHITLSSVVYVHNIIVSCEFASHYDMLCFHRNIMCCVCASYNNVLCMGMVYHLLCRCITLSCVFCVHHIIMCCAHALQLGSCCLFVCLEIGVGQILIRF